MAVIQNMIAQLKSNSFVRNQAALQAVAVNTCEKMSFRRRVTLAEINAGVQLLPALPGYKYRMIDCIMIAVGGAVGATTTVDILGTQAAAAAKLISAAIATLTQSAVVRASTANVLADGASFAECDVNTAITIGKTGATATTATAVDVEFDFEVIEAA